VSQYAFAHVVRIKRKAEILHRFQNFFIGAEATYDSETYLFVPFGFSGVTVNRTGDGLEATLVFPNNTLSRGLADTAISDNYVVEVEVLLVDSDDASGTHNKVHSFVGQVVSGQWDNVSLNLQLSSVLDAVGTDVPRRSLTQRLVGNLPISNNVRLQ
jgi:hypothetical protein|tara:strand:+ start:37 stop:507 length:471 start_codon:yes stop_codon:yes gene_type:complete